MEIDISRLQQALTVEAERGFGNLQGKQQVFADFMSSSLEQSLNWAKEDGDRAQNLATEFHNYAALPLSRRQYIVAETRRLLYDVRRKEITNSTENKSKSKGVKKPKTEPLVPTKSPAKTIPKHLKLDTDLKEVEGLNSNQIAKLKLLDIHTVGDMLRYFPRDHIDYAQQVAIAQLKDSQTVTVIGTIKRFNCFTSPKNENLTIVEIIIRDSTGSIKLNRFWMGKRYNNRGWQEQQKRLYPQGCTVAASGMVKANKYGLTLENFDLEILDHSSDRIESNTIGRVVPVYPLTEGVSPELVRGTIIKCLPVVGQICDPIPDRLRTDYNLMGLSQAIAQIHYPDDTEKLNAAIMRLSFDKYFYRRLVSLYRRQQQKAIHFVPRSQLIEQLEQILPFQLTNAQKRAIAEIREDLQRDSPMNRLVQGDVGSGKTIVAVYALLSAIGSGYQTAFMAPTEVLAEQHYRKLLEWFTLLHIPVELLTGSTKTAKRRQILNQLATGELPLLIGTHALIQDTVHFNQLGLAVIDEQHRFGRDQRSQLLQKGEDPHVLIMTATPIPRTLYLTNSEIEVSIIDELPPGRKPIHTTLLKAGQRKEAYELIKREVAQGRQAYIVLPLVEETEKMENIRAAVQEREYLQASIFPHFKVGLLHGQMSSSEKDEAINEFRRAETQILVATTVVEVGVDIPNASVMLIEHSDRFGLAQLHQLRGRVGRGSAQSFCLLMSASKSEGAIERLKVLEQSQDGFFIAERDFELRGKGKDEGKEQSGHAGFSIDDRLPDEAARQEIYQISRAAAERIMKKDPTLELFPALKTEFDHHYQRLQGGAIFT